MWHVRACDFHIHARRGGQHTHHAWMTGSATPDLRLPPKPDEARLRHCVRHRGTQGVAVGCHFSGGAVMVDHVRAIPGCRASEGDRPPHTARS